MKAAAREIGGIQIQNRGTIAGNLCNASPAADSVPPLLALDAQVELVSSAATRRLALDDFILGNRKTARRADEILARVVIPQPAKNTRAAFLKLGARKYLVISISMVAAVVEIDDAGCVAEARVAVGSCSAKAQRLPQLEQVVRGMRACAPWDQRGGATANISASFLRSTTCARAQNTGGTHRSPWYSAPWKSVARGRADRWRRQFPRVAARERKTARANFIFE